MNRFPLPLQAPHSIAKFQTRSKHTTAQPPLVLT